MSLVHASTVFSKFGGINIPEPEVVNRSKNARQYDGFLRYEQNLKESSDFEKYSPCENFYEYACSKIPVDSYFPAAEQYNVQLAINGLKNPPVSITKSYKTH